MMDESELDPSRAPNNIDVLETETFTDELASRSVSARGAGQEFSIKDGGNADFESLTTRPMSSVSVATNALDNDNLKSKSRVTNEEYINNQENGEYPRSFQPTEALVLPEKSSNTPCQPCLDSNTVLPKTDTSNVEFNFTEPDDFLEDKQSIDSVSKVTKNNVEQYSSLSLQTGPRSSSPIGCGEKESFEYLVNKFKKECEILKLNSTVDRVASITDELSGFNFPEIPQKDPLSSLNRSSIDGGSISNASSSMSRSYMYSSASVDIPNSLESDGDHLIPRYKADGRGFCWPIDKLPLSGDRTFEEDLQWKISKEIGHGASGQCFCGYPVHNEGFKFCVKKCKYKKEEVKAMFLAAKEVHASRGAKKFVLFYGASYYKPDVCIFMEYMEGGTVHEAVNEASKRYKDGLDKSDCVHYLEDILLALEFLHSKGMMHNDVKASNVLLSASGVEAKLCDFDKATAIDKHNSPSRDVWLAGCFLLEMLGKKYSSAWMSGFLKKADVLTILPDDVEPDTYEVLSVCFSEDRNKCTASYVLKSAFF